jgi:hypothetical protein
MSYRVFGEEGHTFSEIEADIESANGTVSPTEELDNFAALGVPVTAGQLDTFNAYAWDVRTLRDFDAFSASLPPSLGGTNAE